MAVYDRYPFNSGEFPMFEPLYQIRLREWVLDHVLLCRSGEHVMTRSGLDWRCDMT
jgi:hypothetical protein